MFGMFLIFDFSVRSPCGFYLNHDKTGRSVAKETGGCARRTHDDDFLQEKNVEKKCHEQDHP